MGIKASTMASSNGLEHGSSARPLAQLSDCVFLQYPERKLAGNPSHRDGGQPAIEDRQPWVRATQFPHQWSDGLNPHVVDHLSGLCPLSLKDQRINP